VPSRRPHRPREGPAREKAEPALNDKKTPKINNWIHNSPITGFKTHLQNQAAEAGVKRWVLTHKHPDLKAEFERRRTASNGVPSAFQALQAQGTDLKDANRRLRADKAELTERVEVYAQVIHELTTQVSRLRAEPAAPASILHLPLHHGKPS